MATVIKVRTKTGAKIHGAFQGSGWTFCGKGVGSRLPDSTKVTCDMCKSANIKGS